MNALERLIDLSDTDDDNGDDSGNKNCIYMGSKNFGLLPVLVEIVSSDNGEAREHALGTLCNLSVEENNSMYMGSKELGLLPVLVEAASSSDDEELLEIILQTIYNLSFLEEKNREFMGSKQGSRPPSITCVSSIVV